MSNLYLQKELSNSKNCPPSSEKPIHQIIHCRETTLGNDLIIRRALPHRERRMIGAWCFLDHFGPLTLNDHKGMNVAPHPHIGLQTVTWLISGNILHRDSLGHAQIISPGELNLMTAGKGITHSEETWMEFRTTQRSTKASNPLTLRKAVWTRKAGPRLD